MSIAEKLSGTSKIKPGAGEKLAAALAAEQQRHQDALSGVVDAADVRQAEVTEALVELERERAILADVKEQAARG